IHEARAEELEIVAILSAAAPDGLAAELDRLGGRSIVINDRKVHVHVDDETAAAVVLDNLGALGIVRLDMEDLRLHEDEGETKLIAVVQGTGLLMHSALNGATALAREVRTSWPLSARSSRPRTARSSSCPAPPRRCGRC